MLRSMALAPLAAGFSKLALPDPVESTPDGAFRVHIARTQPGLGSNGWSANASKCDECIRSSPKYGRQTPNTTVRVVEKNVLQQAAVSLPSGGSETASLNIHQMTFETIGPTGTRSMDVYMATLEHSRYWIGVNVGNGPVKTERGVTTGTTIAVMIGHDLPLPNVDFVITENAQSQVMSSYFDAYRSGLQALRALNLKEGSAALGPLYQSIDAGLALLKSEWQRVVPEDPVPIYDQLVITSLPEQMKFVQMPASVGVAPAGCSCGVSCCCGIGCCIGCGCGLVCACDCGPCCEPSCGCGACCGCDLCS